jgi:hypothetical protein
MKRKTFDFKYANACFIYTFVTLTRSTNDIYTDNEILYTNMILILF